MNADLAECLELAVPICEAWLAEPDSFDKDTSAELLGQVWAQRGADGLIATAAGLQALVEILMDLAFDGDASQAQRFLQGVLQTARRSDAN